MKKLNKQISELIGAAAAHGFYFWSQAPGPGMVWAVGADQSWHLLKVHRSLGKVSHECSAWGEGNQFVGSCRGGGKLKPFAAPESFESAAALFELPESEVAA